MSAIGDPLAIGPVDPMPEPVGGRMADLMRHPAAYHGFWLLRRLISGALVLFAMTVIVFVATTALPGDAASRIAGPDATPQLLDTIRHNLHLDRPVVERYFTWLGHAVQGDFGDSLAGSDTVAGLISNRLVVSLELLIVVMLVSVPLSVIVGSIAAIRRDSALDKTVSTGTLVSLSLPDFVTATLCVLLLGTSVLTIFPATADIPANSDAFSHPKYLLMPATALVIATSAVLIRMMRATMIEILESDYVNMARLRGLSRSRILWRHAVPNALVPTVQASALMVNYVFGGAILVEYVVNYPGLGTLLQSSVSLRDVPVVQAIVLMFAVGVVAANLLSDILTVLLTPKLRTRGAR